MITKWDKAIAALIGALLPIAANLGFNLELSPEVIGTISGVIAMVLTWAVPNKVA